MIKNDSISGYCDAEENDSPAFNVRLSEPSQNSSGQLQAMNSLQLIMNTIDNMTCINDLKATENLIFDDYQTLCASPIHFHSFTKLPSLTSIMKSRFRVCSVCDLRISIMSGDVVTCLACGIFVHRSCVGKWKDECLPKCIVNLEIINTRKSKIDQAHDRDKNGSIASSKAAVEKDETQNMNPIPEEDDDEVLWSASGPPAHWALLSPERLKGLKSSTGSSDTKDDDTLKERNDNIVEDGQEVQDWKTSLSNLSLTLQQNLKIIRKETEEVASVEEVLINDGSENHTDTSMVIESSKEIMRNVSENIQKQSLDEHTKQESVTDISTVLQVSASKPSSPPPKKSTMKIAQDSIQIVKKAQKTKTNMGVASIGGCIVGGVAGLVVAGPAGLYLGSRIGQVAAIAGVLLEGGISIGVLVAGVTGTMMTVNQLKSQEKRVLTLGEKGSDCKVVLVRPNVIVDPEWEQITASIRENAPADRRGDIFPFFGVCRTEKNERQKRDQDIVSCDDELNTQEKIFLLVASSLNDKDSLPGYVYRRLVEEVKSRAIQREEHHDLISEKSSRSVRQDVHGIIKYITATLLEVRPGFCSSPRLTEISAAAVETLVFGELYDIVFAEIVSETADLDQKLSEKFTKVQNEALRLTLDIDRFISTEAIIAIQLLPSYHSVEEKLRCCVQLLEFVSNQGSLASMGADTLLKLVCQHLVRAYVPHLNAECIFLEEFASDGQLLQGKEGYALVTIQASLHFLNSTSDDVLLNDVFGDD